MKTKLITAFVAVTLTFTGIFTTPMAVAAECPLCGPTENGNISEVKRLIAFGADVNVKNDDGRTALIIAASNGYAKIAKILLDAGADVNAKDSAGWTPLIWSEKAEITKMFLDAGADVDAKNNFGKTAAEMAKLGGHTEIANLIKNYKHSKSAVEIKEKTEKAKVEKKQKSRNETKTKTPLTACYDRMTRFCYAGEHDFASNAACIKINHRACRVIN